MPNNFDTVSQNKKQKTTVVIPFVYFLQPNIQTHHKIAVINILDTDLQINIL